MLDKILYNTILCQTFSPCNKYLVAGNIYGQLAVFDLDRILNPVVELLTSDYNRPKYIHNLESGDQICSLASTEKFLIVGTVNEILGWDWKTVSSSKLSKPAWTIRINTSNSTPVEQCDVNSLWLSEDKETLYAGCGDNNVHVYSMEGGQLATYKGHKDFIHSVHGKNDMLVSAGEDGQVILWDRRTGKSLNCIEPHTNSKLARPDLGKWVGAASIGDDWIVCGGGPRLSLWHARAQGAVMALGAAPRALHVAAFHDDCVLAAGAADHLYQLSYNGDVKVELPVSSSTVYSAAISSGGGSGGAGSVLAVAGSSSQIDLCTSFNYRDQVLHFR